MTHKIFIVVVLSILLLWGFVKAFIEKDAHFALTIFTAMGVIELVNRDK